MIAVNRKTNDIYVGGKFQSLGGILLNSIAKWNGTNWIPLKNGVGWSNLGTSSIYFLFIYFIKKIKIVIFAIDFLTNSSGIVVGGSFQSNHLGLQQNNILIWNGTDWEGLDGGVQVILISNNR